jgi:hypothetical protein
MLHEYTRIVSQLESLESKPRHSFLYAKCQEGLAHKEEVEV